MEKRIKALEDKKILAEATKARKITQVELADRLGMLPSGLSANMRRDRMGLDNFLKILNAMEYDVVVVDRKTGEAIWKVDC